ncbi:hypothetical protein PS706_00423 [Pseudomonas fluorescens]|nr:hypothetical protein PS706_00423 [Pseudomonas fluorescens]
MGLPSPNYSIRPTQLPSVWIRSHEAGFEARESLKEKLGGGCCDAGRTECFLSLYLIIARLS